MKNISCENLENLNEAFPKSNIIIIYNEKGESCIKVSYQCFSANEWRKSGIDLKEIIYSNQYLPKDYVGSIFSIKKSICNNDITYETMDIIAGKINQYNFELYNWENKSKILEKVHVDINDIVLKNYTLQSVVKYRSFSNKKKFGNISFSFNKSNKLIDFVVNGNKIYLETVMESILNYQAFLLKFEILNRI